MHAFPLISLAHDNARMISNVANDDGDGNDDDHMDNWHFQWQYESIHMVNMQHSIGMNIMHYMRIYLRRPNDNLDRCSIIVDCDELVMLVLVKYYIFDYRVLMMDEQNSFLLTGNRIEKIKKIKRKINEWNMDRS